MLKKNRVLISIFSLISLSGCFDGHLDCDTEENLKSVSVTISALTNLYAKSAKYYEDLRVHPKLSLKSFEQIQEVDGLNECKYEFDVNQGSEKSTLKVTAEIINIEKGDKSHKVREINADTWKLSLLTKSAINQSKTLNLQDKASKYGFKNVDDYQSFLILKKRLNKVESTEKSLTSDIARLTNEIKVSTENLPIQINKKENIKSELRKKLTVNGKSSFKLTYGVTLNITEVDLHKQLLKGSFTNTNFSDLEWASLKLYVYEKNNVERPIFTSRDRSGSTFNGTPSTHPHISFGGSWGTSKEKGEIKDNFYGELGKSLKRNSHIAKAKLSELRILLVPKSYNIDDRYKSNLAKDYDLPEKLVKQSSVIRNIIYNLSKNKKLITEKNDLLLLNKKDKEELIAKTINLSPNKTLTL